MELNNFSPEEMQRIVMDEQIIMAYSGTFDQTIIKSILKYVEGKLDDEGVDELIKRRVFNVMVEMLQNISKHQFCHNSDSLKPIFVLSQTETHYSLQTGNFINIEVIDPVREKIDKINGMNETELKAYYKEKRLASRISEVGGAGLGFIDMARKTNNPLDYDFLEIDSTTFKFFTLKTKLNK